MKSDNFILELMWENKYERTAEKLWGKKAHLLYQIVAQTINFQWFKLYDTGISWARLEEQNREYIGIQQIPEF